MISALSTGSFDRTKKFLSMMQKGDVYKVLDHYGALGVQALASATPVESGLTATSWTFDVIKKGESWYSIIWRNTNVRTGVPVAILIQYGHGTGTGGWVEGRDYINPAIQHVFDQVANDVWKQVTNG